jgi:hypothetical protein
VYCVPTHRRATKPKSLGAMKSPVGSQSSLPKLVARHEAVPNKAINLILVSVGSLRFCLRGGLKGGE